MLFSPFSFVLESPLGLLGDEVEIFFNCLETPFLVWGWCDSLTSFCYVKYVCMLKVQTRFIHFLSVWKESLVYSFFYTCQCCHDYYLNLSEFFYSCLFTQLFLYAFGAVYWSCTHFSTPRPENVWNFFLWLFGAQNDQKIDFFCFEGSLGPIF